MTNGGACFVNEYIGAIYIHMYYSIAVTACAVDQETEQHRTAVHKLVLERKHSQMHSISRNCNAGVSEGPRSGLQTDQNRRRIYILQRAGSRNS